MAKILSIHYNGKLRKNISLKCLMEPFKYFKYLDKFTATSIIIFVLLSLSTPFIIKNEQVFTLKAQIAGKVVGNTFTESFIWQGDHGAAIGGGTSNTVWWNAHNWDARADTGHNSCCATGNLGGTGTDHIDIHVGSSSLEDGTRLNNKFVVNGDGGPGVATMHLDFEAIESGRLRNPMLISAASPGVVEFRATNFVTSGHWWEVAITPTNIVVGGELTAVPSTADSFGGLQGSGHRPAEDSINFIIIGENDVPCTTGWKSKVGVTKIVNDISTDFLSPTRINTDPSEADKLFKWRLEYYPDKIVAFRDGNNDGVLELFDTFNVTIPWSEVYVHLLGVAYQADKHPQGACFQGQIRELTWRDVKVGPVKYAYTRAYPKEQGTSRIPRDTGWLGYDTRDTQRFGVVNGISQPNSGPYNKHSSMAFCLGSFFGCTPGTAVKTLTFDLPAGDAAGISHAQLIYDIKKTGSAILAVNGQMVGAMPKWDTVGYPQTGDPFMWAQRSIEVNPSLFVAGVNTITLSMSGDIAFDRLQFEFGYGKSGSGGVAPSVTPFIPLGGNLPWLKTSGNKIQTVSGQTVVLRGANIMRSEWVGNMDFERIAYPELARNWKGNLVLRGFASDPVNSNDAGYLAILDEEQKLAESNNMYIIFAWRSHAINGDQPPMPDDAAQQALVKLAERFKDKSNVIYALQVEPHDVSWSSLLPRFNSMVTAIRKASFPNKPIIMVPGTQFGRDVHWAITEPITADNGINIVYKSHPYDGSSFFQQYFLDTHKANLPVFIGEFGTGTSMNQVDVNALLTTLRTENISWAAWLFDSEGCPCLLTDRITLNTTAPYGVSVKNEMLNTPPIPPISPTPIPTNTPTPTPIRTPTSTTILPTPTRTPTPTPIVPAISSFNKGHIFLDKPEKLTLSGENLRNNDLFIFRLKTGNTTSLEISNLRPLFNTTNLEVDFTRGAISSLPHGFYTIEIQRISDGHRTSHTEELLITKLGDIWSSTATSTSIEPRDGKIDIFDVSRLLPKWKSTDPIDLKDGDINGPNGIPDGRIDIYDANKLMANWTL